MKTVLSFADDTRHSNAERTAGIMHYAKCVGWHIQAFTGVSDYVEIKQLIRFWNADGLIFSCGKTGKPPGSFNLPTVLCASDRRKASCATTISADSVAIGTMAAKELIRTGYQHMSIVAYPGKLPWSRDREDGFLSAMRLNHRKILRLHPRTPMDDDVASQREIINLVEDLPKHTAVYCVNDRLAARVIIALRKCGRRIPEDCAVLGTDNYEDFCESCRPTLSSIALDFVANGFLAGEELDRLMDGAKPRHIQTPPVGLIRRASLPGPKMCHREVTTALSFIRAHASENISSADVIRVMGGSRRLMEMRFREATGHSILADIQQVRLERACLLLHRPTISLTSIPHLVGYGSPTSFHRLFKKTFGMTMGEWQRRNTSQKE